MPAFAGMTKFRTYYKIIKIDNFMPDCYICTKLTLYCNLRVNPLRKFRSYNLNTERIIKMNTGPDQNKLLRQNYQLFSSFYRGRTDQVAVKKDGVYSVVSGGFTFERFKEHVELINTYALYQMDDNGDVSFCLFDLDVLPRKQDWSVLVKKIALEKEKTKQVIKTLYDFGFKRENILIEFPTVGYHLLLSFTNPTPATVVKEFVRMTLEKSGLADTPFYPRTTDKGSTGDRIQLPFRTNTNTGKRANLLTDIDSFDPENYDPAPDFSPLEKVTPIAGERIVKLVENSTL